MYPTPTPRVYTTEEAGTTTTMDYTGMYLREKLLAKAKAN